MKKPKHNLPVFEAPNIEHVHHAPDITRIIIPGYRADRLTDFLDTVRRRCRFGKWFCGHYHINQVIDERFVIQWEQILKID